MLSVRNRVMDARARLTDREASEFFFFLQSLNEFIYFLFFFNLIYFFKLNHFLRLHTK